MGGFGAKPVPGQVQQGFGGFCAKVRLNTVSEKVPEKVAEALVRFNRICGHQLTETQLRCFQGLALQHGSERFVKIERCGCRGYHRSVLFFASACLDASVSFLFVFHLGPGPEHFACAMCPDMP